MHGHRLISYLSPIELIRCLDSGAGRFLRSRIARKQRAFETTPRPSGWTEMPTRQKTSQAKDAPARALDVVRRLAAEYPDAKCALRFGNPLELLIATILSAQCTDERVNIVTRDLFKKYKSAKDYAS